MNYLYTHHLIPEFSIGKQILIAGRKLTVRHLFKEFDGCLATSADGSQLYNVTRRGFADPVSPECAAEMIVHDRDAHRMRNYTNDLKDILKEQDREAINSLFARSAA